MAPIVLVTARCTNGNDAYLVYLAYHKAEDVLNIKKYAKNYYYLDINCLKLHIQDIENTVYDNKLYNKYFEYDNLDYKITYNHFLEKLCFSHDDRNKLIYIGKKNIL